MSETFVSEPLKPVLAGTDTSRTAAGEPVLPAQFVWRDRTLQVLGVLRSWKETGPCRHGSGELYVRKHWYEVASSAGVLKIYFERQPRGGRHGTRWWLFSIRTPEGGSAL